MEMNMRGLQTPVRNIRRRVFTEVAKLGFKADADTLLDDMEAIPYMIVNDDTEKYRESTYRSRAIVRERLRLAMGLSLRPENKPVHLTAGVEASNISEKYYEPPLMQVIPSACDSCEENMYEVEQYVQGMSCTSMPGGLSKRSDFHGRRTLTHRSGKMHQMREMQIRMSLRRHCKKRTPVQEGLRRKCNRFG